MEINTNLSAGQVGATPASRSTNRSQKGERESAEFGHAAALDSALRGTPESRVEEIERALALVGDPAYPPRETLEGIANLLAMKMTSR